MGDDRLASPRVSSGSVRPINADLSLALELADAADALTMSRFRADDLRVDRKSDTTHVTEADRAAEVLITTGGDVKVVRE